MSTVEIMGNDVSIEELKSDVEAAFDLGYANKYAFIPETVQALLEYIEKLEQCLQIETSAIKYNGDFEISDETYQVWLEHG